MPENGEALRRIAWREVLPWLIIFRCFRISISPPILFVATVGWFLTPLGPMIASTLFDVDADATWTSSPDGLDMLTEDLASGESLLSKIAFTTCDPIRYVYGHFTDPFREAFDRQSTTQETAYHVFSGLWNIAIWAFFAGAITRIAAVQLGREERVDMRDAIQYATKHYCWNGLAPLFPLFGVLPVAGSIALLGLLMRLDVGVVLAGLLWPLVLIGGLIMTVLLLGLVAGWPLMWPTISSEDHGDAFEAFSRSFSYVFQRPLHYLFYFLIAALFGGVSWLLVSAFSETVVELCLYAASWGASSERIEGFGLGEHGAVLSVGLWLISMCEILVRCVAIAFNFSFFFCASTAIYLLMRREVDQSGFDDVFVEDEQDRFSLPPLDPGKGMPEESDVSDKASPSPGTDDDSDQP